MKYWFSILLISAVALSYSQVQSDPIPANQTAMDRAQMSKYRLEVLEGNDAKATEPFTLRVALKDNSGVTARNFGSTKAAEMHLIIANPGFGYFQVLSPTMNEDGSWSTPNVILPYGGNYWVFADGGPSGDVMPVVVGKLTLQGDGAPSTVTAYTSNKSGNAVWASSQTMTSGGTSTLTFNLQDPVNSEPIIDVQPYMAANAHLFIISDDGRTFLHAKAADTASTNPGTNLVTFNTMFPRPGRYTAFLMFKRSENVNTVPFSITVQ